MRDLVERDDAKHCEPHKKWVGYGVQGKKKQDANWEEHVQSKKHKENIKAIRGWTKREASG
ncbi:hypothetical protein B0H19DRAFT_712195 [Mycena capillaripes]|nr:hypothetical protein B0H19DRAFT_712195 [Mycena capillaripes]